MVRQELSDLRAEFGEVIQSCQEINHASPDVFRMVDPHGLILRSVSALKSECCPLNFSLCPGDYCWDDKREWETQVYCTYLT